MNKLKKLEKGDKVAIISLSAGVLGEKFVEHEIKLGEKRLKQFGLSPVYMPNSLKGIKYLSEHPEARASDLKTAFADNSIKAIFCAIGGNDTYRTIPYLLEDDEFISLVKNNPKIFMGFSDTTTNHLMFQRLGLNTFYGPAFLVDFAELDSEMLPYTKEAINYLFDPKPNHQILSSPVWYEDRTDFSASAIDTPRATHTETKGYELLQGKGKVQGKLLGGCIESFALLAGLREKEDTNPEEAYKISQKYQIFPTAEEWENKIAFFETSEAKISPEFFETIIKKFKKLNVFDNLAGIVVGKPDDEKYYDEYKQILSKELAMYDFPVLINLNFGHASPRTIIPYGATAEIDAENKTFTIVDTTIE